jgi:uncharacterized protein YaaW (UPF0174 family)
MNTKKSRHTLAGSLMLATSLLGLWVQLAMVTGQPLLQALTLADLSVLLTGTQYGRVRALFDENGKQTDAAGPSIPATPSSGT